MQRTSVLNLFLYVLGVVMPHGCFQEGDDLPISLYQALAMSENEYGGSHTNENLQKYLLSERG